MLLKASALTFGAALIVASGTLGLMASQRTPPIRILESELLTPKVRPGGALLRRIRLEQTKICNIHTDRILYDGQDNRYILDPVELQSGLGGNGKMEYNTRIVVPPDAAFGKAKIVTTPVYRCNLVHWLFPIRGAPTVIEFEIVPL